MRYRVAVLLLLVACSSTSSTVAVGENMDGSGQLACQRFVVMARDISLMTFEEQRQAAQDVWDKARYSDDTVVREGARDMLDALTPTVDGPALRQAVTTLANACT